MSAPTVSEYRPTPRMRLGGRRESILEAATGVLGQRGHVGTEVIAPALVRLRAVLPEGTHGLGRRRGAAYLELLRERGLPLELGKSQRATG